MFELNSPELTAIDGAAHNRAENIGIPINILSNTQSNIKYNCFKTIRLL